MSRYGYKNTKTGFSLGTTYEQFDRPFEQDMRMSPKTLTTSLLGGSERKGWLTTTFAPLRTTTSE